MHEGPSTTLRETGTFRSVPQEDRVNLGVKGHDLKQSPMQKTQKRREKEHLKFRELRADRGGKKGQKV